MKKILVPIDFSETSKRGLVFAIHFAQALNAEIILFHSYSPVLATAEDLAYPLALQTENEMLSEVNKQTDDLLALVKKRNVITQKIIRFGLLGDLIQDIVDETKADLVITGMHSPNGFERMIVGTNSINFFQKVKIPVLVIPEKAVYHDINNIMYATDFRYGDLDELQKVCELARLFNAHVVAVHICTNQDEVAEDNETMDWFGIAGDSRIHYDRLSYRTILNEDVLQGLSNAIESSHTDIVCLSTVGKNFWRRITSTSTTKHMAYHTKVPLLVVHLQE